MKTILTVALVCLAFAACGGQEPFNSCDEDACDDLTCTATMGVRVVDEIGHTIVGAEVFAVGVEGHLFGYCVTEEGGENSNKDGYQFHNGCNLTELPLETPLGFNVVVNGITSFAEMQWELSSIVSPPNYALIIRLDDDQY